MNNIGLNSPTQAQLLEEKHRAADRAQRRQDIRDVLATEAGRRLLMHMTFQSGLYDRTRKSDNVAYLAGRRDAIIDVLSLCNEVAPELVLKARSERHQDITNKNFAIQTAIEEDQYAKGR